MNGQQSDAALRAGRAMNGLVDYAPCKGCTGPYHDYFTDSDRTHRCGVVTAPQDVRSTHYVSDALGLLRAHAFAICD